MKKIIITILLLVLSPLTLASPEVVLEPVPDQGIQPVLERDAEGGIHLLYFSRVKEGSGYYLYRQRTDSGWSEAKRVNPEPVRASDVIGRADMAVGMNGKVHVTYFSGDYFYSQLDPASNTFSRPRKVATKLLEGIEAGAAVSVQGQKVAVVWHAGNMRDESSRQVVGVFSKDDGRSFGEALAISDKSLGACACCGMTSRYTAGGDLQVAYRTAIENTGRHMQLFMNGKTDQIGEWFIDACPVSTNQFNGQSLVFETEGRVYLHRMDNYTSVALAPDVESKRQKHPSVAENDTGIRLIVWGDAPGYVAGGLLNAAAVLPDGSVAAINVPEVSIQDYGAAAVEWLTADQFLVLY